MTVGPLSDWYGYKRFFYQGTDNDGVVRTFGYGILFPYQYNSSNSYPLVCCTSGSGGYDTYNDASSYRWNLPYLINDDETHDNDLYKTSVIANRPFVMNINNAYYPELTVELINKIINGTNEWWTTSDCDVTNPPETVNIDSDRVYYTGHSLGALATYNQLIEGRELFAALAPLDIYFNAHTIQPLKDIFDLFYINWRIGFYISLALYDQYYASPTSWNSELEVFNGNTLVEGVYYEDYYNIVNNAIENIVIRTKHIPILHLAGTISPEQALYFYKKRRELGTSDTSFAPMFYMPYYIYDGSQKLFTHNGPLDRQISYGYWRDDSSVHTSGSRYVFDTSDWTTISGFYEVAEGSEESYERTVWEWMLSKSKSTNPTIEEDIGAQSICQSYTSGDRIPILNMKPFTGCNISYPNDKTLSVFNNDTEIQIKNGAIVIDTMALNETKLIELFNKKHYIKSEQSGDNIKIRIVSPQQYTLL